MSSGGTGGSSCATLASGQSLGKGQSKKSCDGRFTLILQTDGNLVLYGPSGALWSSNTAGSAASVAAMQTDGNFVVYAGATPLWWSNTANNPGAFLSVQNDGNTVIYKGATALWSTKTCCH